MLRNHALSPEPPTWAKEILKALEAKTEEVKVVKEQLDLLKRKSAEEEPEFKYKSNRKQFKFNTDIKDKFNQILERAGADDAIIKIANKCMSLLDNRNTLISIADRDGWDVVEYFEADPLTNNDEEEKKLCVARKEAERSWEKRIVFPQFCCRTFFRYWISTFYDLFSLIICFLFCLSLCFAQVSGLGTVLVGTSCAAEVSRDGSAGTVVCSFWSQVDSSTPCVDLLTS